MSQKVAKYLSTVNNINNAIFTGYSNAQVVGLYTVYTFLNNGSITYNGYSNMTLNVLAIGGGGAGGDSGGGGGGAGGMVQTTLNISSGTSDFANINIGTGGTYGTGTGSGNNSTISFAKLTNYNITSFGGGSGGNNGSTGLIGGSGGGSGINAINTGGSNYTTSQGNQGGANNSSTYSGGSGGGGALTAGYQSGNARSGAQEGQYAGNGGNGKICNLIGINSLYPNTYWAGGGGGASQTVNFATNINIPYGSTEDSRYAGIGGLGGGGGGASQTSLYNGTGNLISLNSGTNGANGIGGNGGLYTGSGGGGGWTKGGNGGAGVIMISVLTSDLYATTGKTIYISGYTSSFVNGNYTIYTYLNSASSAITYNASNSSFTVYTLMVGGGGAGGSYQGGGGGGGGGFIAQPVILTSSDTISINIGIGGNPNVNNFGTNGGNSGLSFTNNRNNNLIAYGGGGGGPGLNGGSGVSGASSGGGGSANNNYMQGSTITYINGQGYPGTPGYYTSTINSTTAGGGGGAGGPASAPTLTNAGNGGIGAKCPSYVYGISTSIYGSYYWAGGGGGGVGPNVTYSTASGGNGGLGGGGGGGVYINSSNLPVGTYGINGNVALNVGGNTYTQTPYYYTYLGYIITAGNGGTNTGGGGGGNSYYYNNNSLTGGYGGSGIVIIAILTSNFSSLNTPTITNPIINGFIGYKQFYTTNDNYTIFIYNNDYTGAITYSNLNINTEINVLAIGGGGGGGSGGGGGGGAGGVVQMSFILNGSDTIDIKVGSGGKGIALNSIGSAVNQGQNSSITFKKNIQNNIIAYGGGYGATYNSNASSGGSGGGGTTAYGISTGVPSQGNAGGIGPSIYNDFTKFYLSNPPIAAYNAQNWSGTTGMYWNGTNWYAYLYDQIGGYDAIIYSYGYTNNVPLVTMNYDTSGNVFNSSLPIYYLKGTKTCGIDWPTFPSTYNYTICCITRYVGPTYGRVMQSSNTNALYGHWNTSAGVVFNNTWVTNSTSSYINDNRWIVTCFKTGPTIPNDVIINGVNSGTATSVNYTVLPKLSINSNGQYTGEFSEWGFAHLAVWTSSITDAELQLYSNLMINYLTTGQSIYSTLFKTIPPQIGYVSGAGGGGASSAGNTNNNFIQTLFQKTPPWGAYTADNWNNNTLYDITGNNRNATTSSVTYGFSSGNGATAAIPYLQGSTSSRITWPVGSIPQQFTIASITRYSGTNRGRILSDNGSYLIHGHWSGLRGVCYYNQWVTQNVSSNDVITDWLVTVGTNNSIVTYPYNVIISNSPITNGTNPIGNATSNSNNNNTNSNSVGLSINQLEQSDFQFNTVLIWDKGLTGQLMQNIAYWLTQYLQNGISIINSLSRTFVGGNGTLCTLNGIKSYFPSTYWGGGGGGANIGGAGGAGGAGGGGGGSGSTAIGVSDISGYSTNYINAIVNSTGANGATFTGGGGGGSINGSGGDGGKGIVIISVKSNVSNLNTLSSASVTNIGPYNAQINFTGNYNIVTISRNNIVIASNASSPYYDVSLNPNTNYTYVITPYASLNVLPGTPYTINITTGSAISTMVPYNIISIDSLLYCFQFDLSYIYYIPSNNTVTIINNTSYTDNSGAFYIYNYATGQPSLNNFGRVSNTNDSISTINGYISGASSYYRKSGYGINIPINLTMTSKYPIIYNGNNYCDFSFAFWMYWTGYMNTPYFLSINSNNQYSYGISIINSTSGYIWFNQIGNTNYIVNTNIWYHIAFVSSGKNSATTLYVNGVKAFVAYPYTYYNNINFYNMYIGSDNNSGTNYFIGYFNDWRIYTRELTASDILTLYNYPALYLNNNNSSISNQLISITQINNLYVGTITSTSVNLFFTGNYNTVSISRNGVTIVSNQKINSYIDTNVSSFVLYTYVVTPYNSNNIPGPFKNISVVCPSVGNNNVPGHTYINTGLYWCSYNGYFADDVNFSSTYPLLNGANGNKKNTGITNDFTSLTTATNGNWISNGGINYFTVEWIGYFYTNQYNGTWTVSTNSDDASYLWIGSNAISGYTTANAIINNGGTHGTVLKTNTISLTSYTYYPIRIQFGQSYAGYDMIVTWTPPGAGSFTNGYIIAVPFIIIILVVIIIIHL